MPLLLLMVIASFAVFAYGAVQHPTATFYLLPTRMWQLGAGCLLAVSSNRKPFEASSLGTLTGISLIVLSFCLPVTASGIGYEALAAVAGACFVISSGSNRVSSIFLQNRSAVFIGRISYSLYLWHWPIMVSLKKIRDYGFVTSDTLLSAIGIGSLTALSLLSFYLIEEPFRRLKYGTPIVLCFALAIGMYFVVGEPNIINQSYSSKYNIPSWHGRYYDLKPHGKLGETFEVIADSIHTPERQVSPVAFKEGGIIRQRSTADPRVVLIGDSHAVSWSKVVDEVTDELGLTTSLWSMNGESPFMQIPLGEKQGRDLTKSERFEYDSQRMALIKKWNPDIVIVASRWENVDENSVADLFQFLESSAKHVLLIESPPLLDGVGNRSLFQYMAFLGITPSSSQGENQVWERVRFDRTISTRRKVVDFALARPGFSFLPTADLFATDRGAIVASGKEIFYVDDDHLTDEGAEVARKRIKEGIQNILNGDLERFPIVSKQGEKANKTLHSTALPRSE